MVKRYCDFQNAPKFRAISARRQIVNIYIYIYMYAFEFE